MKKQNRRNIEPFWNKFPKMIGIITFLFTFLSFGCSTHNGNVHEILTLPVDKYDASLDIAISADSRLIASASQDGSIYIWSGINGKQIRHFPHTGETFNGITFSPDSRLIAASSKSGVHFWKIEDGHYEQTIGEDNIWPGKVAISPDSTLVAINSGISVEVWQIADNQRVFQQMLPVQSPQKIVAFSPSSSRLAYSSGGSIAVYDLDENTEIVTINNGARTADFTSDGQSLITTSVDEVFVTELLNGQTLNHFTTDFMDAGISSVNGIRAGIYYDRLQNPGNDNGVEVENSYTGVGISVWDITKGELIWRESNEEMGIYNLFGVILSSDGTLLANRSIKTGDYIIFRLEIPTKEN